MNTNMSHVNISLCIDDPDGWIMITVLNDQIEPVNNGNQLRDHFIEIVDGPGLERFVQNRVIRIRACLCHDADGFHK